MDDLLVPTVAENQGAATHPAASPFERQVAIAPEARVAMIGAGAFGQFCLEAYRQTDDISVAAVVDPNLTGMAPVAYPQIRIASDVKAVLQDASIEAIHLATPPFLRAEVILPALRAGKSVLCEKPLTLSLSEADQIIDVARHTGRTVGVNYILRHHPAFQLLVRLATSDLFGSFRTLSFQNFAQALPRGHWMWDLSKSGGILVEHGVHFFDAYGQIAGMPQEAWGTAPKREAVQVTVRHANGAIAGYYHEFAFPQAVERTHAIAFFERGYVEIDGWIPDRLSGRVLASAGALQTVIRPVQVPVKVWQDAGVTHFDVQFPDRRRAYQSAIVAGMRDVVARHRDPSHAMIVTAQDARESLALALAARRVTETGRSQRLTG
jgi:predicted dehydrogenase